MKNFQKKYLGVKHRVPWWKTRDFNSRDFSSCDFRSRFLVFTWIIGDFQLNGHCLYLTNCSHRWQGKVVSMRTEEQHRWFLSSSDLSKIDEFCEESVILSEKSCHLTQIWTKTAQKRFSVNFIKKNIGMGHCKLKIMISYVLTYYPKTFKKVLKSKMTKYIKSVISINHLQNWNGAPFWPVGK